MHGNRGILVGVGGLDLGGQREFRHHRLPDRKQLPGEGGNRGIREVPTRDNMVGEADRLDVVVGSVGRAAEGPGGDVGRFVIGMVLRDRLGRIDRKEGRRATVARRCRYRLRGDLAVDRSGGEIGVRLLVADGLRDLAGRKLNDLDLGGIHAVLLQDHLEQIDIGLGAADHADAMPGKLRNFGDLRAGLAALDLAGRGNP